MKYSFINEENGKRVISLLSEKIDGLTLSVAKRQLKSREIKVNGSRVDSNVVLDEGDRVDLFLPAGSLAPQEIRVVYEDDNIAVVCKPAGMDTENNLISAMRRMGGREYLPVHRLDRNTSGLIMLAKDEQSRRLLTDAIKRREVKKTYRALLYGNFENKSLRSVAYLKKDAAAGRVTVTAQPSAGSLRIETGFKIIADHEGWCEAEIDLVTGRTHQIRAHAAFLGHPVLGDGKYGDGSVNKKFGYKNQQLTSVKIKIEGLKGKLEYLNGHEFVFDDVNNVKSY